MSAQQYGLGRGLSSLIPQNKTVQKKKTILEKTVESESLEQDMPRRSRPSDARDQGVLEVSTEHIKANPHQPRQEFNDEKLRELSASIKEKGILQPLIVTKAGGSYELIAGERRLRASAMAGLKTVPVIVRKFAERDKLEMAVVENIQRHDLNPLEEARGYKKLIEEFSLSQEEVAKKMGKSRSGIANTLRLLSLPVEIQRALSEEKISEGHAKALLSIENAEKQRALFRLILKEGLTVRQTEAKSSEARTHVRSHVRTTGIQDPQLKAVEDDLNEKLGTKVQVKKQGNGAEVRIQCYSREELVSLVNKMR